MIFCSISVVLFQQETVFETTVGNLMTFNINLKNLNKFFLEQIQNE